MEPESRETACKRNSLIGNSIMVAGLNKIDSFMPDDINQAMLLSGAARPHTRTEKLQRFGFSDSLEWIFQDGFYQLKYAKRGFAVRCNPVFQIFSKFRVKHGLSLYFFRRLLYETPTQYQPRCASFQSFGASRRPS